MFEKTASDAFFMGAQSALASLNIPGHIKEAALNYMIKTAADQLPVLVSQEQQRLMREAEQVAASRAADAAAAQRRFAASPEALQMLRESQQAGPLHGRVPLGMQSGAAVEPVLAKAEAAAAAEAQAVADKGGKGLGGLAKLRALAGKNPRAAIGLGALTALGVGGGTAYGLGAFDEEEAPLPQDLMSRIRRGELNTELALGGAGLAALGGGAAYALS